MYTLYGNLILNVDPIVWSEDALKYSEINEGWLYESSSKQQN